MPGITSLPHVEYATSPDVRRTDVLVQSAPGISVFLRSLDTDGDHSPGRPLLLLHGARAASVASFDLDVTGGSFAADLARRGFAVYLFDARGYGGSTRTDAMDRPPEENEPLSRSSEVVQDIAAAAEHIRERHRTDALAVMGWATGSQWLAHSAAEYPERVSHLILFNGLWPVAGAWPVGDRLEDPERPGNLRPGALPAYGFADERGLLQRWESSIPDGRLDDWRDPEVASAYAQTAISSDPTAGDRSPPSLRTPLGAMADSFLLSRGHRPFDPGGITARVLAIRSEHDFWSRPLDLEAIQDDLSDAASVETLTLPDATHFAHLDRPERGREHLLDRVSRFLS